MAIHGWIDAMDKVPSFRESQMQGMGNVDHEASLSPASAQKLQEFPVFGLESQIGRPQGSRLPCQPRRAALGAVRVVLVEHNPLCRETVQAGRIDPAITVAA